MEAIERMNIELTNRVRNNTSRGNILIVDDTPDNLYLLSVMLTQHGYEVRSAINGPVALMTIQVELPDLILLDINMPKMNGYEICEHLQSNEQTREIPVIFLSAFNEAIDKVKAFRSGGVDYITKPFQVEEVLVRVEHQLTLHRMRTELQQARAEALKALEQEKELNRLKSEFVAMISHDFRTPLTSIQGFADLLRHNRQTLSPEIQNRYFDKIDTAVDHLLRLLNEVLLIGSIEAHKVQYQPIETDLEKFCHDLIESLHLNSGSQPPIYTNCTGDCTQVKVDQTLLQQILSNLLSNAIKYSPSHKPIQFRLHCQNDLITIQVQDQGIGIPAEGLLHIFDAFYRCHNVDRIKGTGLGLAVVKKCVEVHQGQIQVDSQEGVGTTFTVTLSTSDSPHQADSLKTD